jgi:uncharacterized protein (TIGR00661 family)
MEPKPSVLFAVLNWGLGHASRSIALISALQSHGYEVHLASDGPALELLATAFPELQKHQLPELRVVYGKAGNQAFNMGKKSAQLIKWYQQDKKALAKLLVQHHYVGVISDNRPGFYTRAIPCAYMTHQLRVKAGLATPIARFLHKKLFRHFDQIWVPDKLEEPRMAGDLSRAEHLSNVRYIGPLSDLEMNQSGSVEFDLGIILSGPEPQRTILESKLIQQLAASDKAIALVRGTHTGGHLRLGNNWRVFNLASRSLIQVIFQQSEVIVARCGYSTLMDLYNFPKPAILIPTPGQPEQEYLATLALHNEAFDIQLQQRVDLAGGVAKAKEKFSQRMFDLRAKPPNWKELFRLFEGK